MQASVESEHSILADNTLVWTAKISAGCRPAVQYNFKHYYV